MQKYSMKNNSLVSVIIISYKNFHYIIQAIDSVLFQNYPNIELIISNDGSSDFDKPAIEKYLKEHAKKNIKRIVVNNNKINLGTVKNANFALKLAKGEYIILFAADDIIYNQDVVSNFVNSFGKISPSELIVTSQIGMYDLQLKRLIQPFISNKNKNLIKKLKAQELFAEMATKCIIPGCGTCYKKKLFEEYGYFDERYKLVEDYSSALKFSRLGIKYNYFDFISFKHRHGGISHGNIKGENKTSKQYELDIINILKNEVLPYTNYLTKKQIKLFTQKLNKLVFQFEYQYEFFNTTKSKKRQFLKNNIKIFFYDFLSSIAKDIYDQFTGKKAKLLLLGIIFSLFGTYFRIIGLFIIIFSILLMFLYLLKKYLPKLIKFIEFIL